MMGLPLPLLWTLGLCVPGTTDPADPIGGTTDQLATLRFNLFDKKQRVNLEVGFPFLGFGGPVQDPPPGGASDGSGNGGGGPIAQPPLVPLSFGSDGSFFRYAGASPIRHAFGADFDGDMTDEIVVLREFVDQGGRYTLSVHRTPSGFQNVSKPIERTASDAIGPRPQFGTIIAADGIDVDGDLRDEIMVVRQVASGAQRLEIYSLPAPPTTSSKKSKQSPISKAELGAPIASYLDLGFAPTDTIVDIAAVDMNGDAKEEIAVLRRALDGTQSIDVIPSPKVVADLAPAVFATTVLPPQTKEILEIDATDIDGDGIDELVVRSQIDIEGPLTGAGTISTSDFFDRLDFLPLPTGGTIIPGVAPAEPMILPFGPGSVMADLVILRGPNPKPGIVSLPLDILLNASFHGKLSLEVVSGDYVGGGGSVTAGPFTGATGKLDGSGFTLDIPGANAPIGGALDPATGVVDVSAEGASSALDLPIPGSNSTLHVVFSGLHVTALGSIAVVQGTFSGVVVNAEGKEKPIDGGQLSFVKD